MNRYVNQDIVAATEPVCGGARVDRGRIKFDWNVNDTEDDVILFKEVI